ncbi:hypothetical protein N2152v2_006648 [Parachlorella kessleri]
MLALVPTPVAFVCTSKRTVRRPAVQVAAAAAAELPSSSSSSSSGAAASEEVSLKHPKTSCKHPGRPLSAACPDCPRKGARVCMAKSKCVHPQRPLSAACPDCPRLKK